MKKKKLQALMKQRVRVHSDVHHRKRNRCRQRAVLQTLLNYTHSHTNKNCFNDWFPNLVLLQPQLFLFHVVTIIHPEDFTQCTTHGSFVLHWHETAYNMFTFSCLFLLPLVIMITCYTRIFCEITKRLKTDKCKFDPWVTDSNVCQLRAADDLSVVLLSLRQCPPVKCICDVLRTTSPELA